MIRGIQHVLLGQGRGGGFDDIGVVVDSDQWDWFDISESYDQLRDYSDEIPGEAAYIKSWTGGESTLRMLQNNSTYAPGTYQGGISKGNLGGNLNGERVDAGEDARNLSDGVLFAVGFRFFSGADSARVSMVSGASFGIDMSVDVAGGTFDCSGYVGLFDAYSVNSAVFQSLITTNGDWNSAILYRAPGSLDAHLYINGTLVGGGPIATADDSSGTANAPVLTLSGNGRGVAYSPSNYPSKGHVHRMAIIFGESDPAKISALHAWLTQI